jgi:hypothetical protein
MDHNQAAVNATRPDDRSIARSFGYAAVDPLAGGSHTRSEFTEAAGVDQHFNPFPGSQFAPAVLALNVPDAATDQVFLLNIMIAFNGLIHSLTHCDFPYCILALEVLRPKSDGLSLILHSQIPNTKFQIDTISQ